MDWAPRPADLSQARPHAQGRRSGRRFGFAQGGCACSQEGPAKGGPGGRAGRARFTKGGPTRGRFFSRDCGEKILARLDPRSRADQRRWPAAHRRSKRCSSFHGDSGGPEVGRSCLVHLRARTVAGAADREPRGEKDFQGLSARSVPQERPGGVQGIRASNTRTGARVAGLFEVPDVVMARLTAKTNLARGERTGPEGRSNRGGNGLVAGRAFFIRGAFDPRGKPAVPG